MDSIDLARRVGRSHQDGRHPQAGTGLAEACFSLVTPVWMPTSDGPGKQQIHKEGLSGPHEVGTWNRSWPLREQTTEREVGRSLSICLSETLASRAPCRLAWAQA